MNKTKTQSRYWLNIATIGAFAGLALIIFTYWIGVGTWIQYAAIAITSLFFTLAVIWWFWAVYQIMSFSSYVMSLKTVIKEVKEDLQDIRKNIK